MPTKPKSLEGHQIGGSHYKGLVIEPYQFAMTNGWDPASFTILKRLSRYDKKDKRQDLEKTLHEIAIRIDLFRSANYPFLDGSRSTFMSMQTYIAANKFEGKTASALHALEGWVLFPQDTEYLPALRSIIIEMIAGYGDPEKAPS